MHNCYDFVIIGQGLAGSILAMTLIDAGHSIMVIDDDHTHSASKVAAGIINPITGHRLNLTHDFQTYFPVADTFYHDTEKQLGSSFYQSIEQTRLVKNKGQQSYLRKRLSLAEYQPYVMEGSSNSPFADQQYGSATIGSSAVVNSPVFLQNCKHFLEQLGAYTKSKIDYQRITVKANSIQLGDITCKKVIFCEGYQAQKNPWLSDLPFKLSKGEVLSLKRTELPEGLYNWGSWILQTDFDTKLGSSYQWDNLGHQPSMKVREKLVASLRQNLQIDPQVIAHSAGIRPTTLHRTPFIGPISTFCTSDGNFRKQGYCFNGFGSKGCLMIPYYAKLLLDHLQNRRDLPVEVTRFL